MGMISGWDDLVFTSFVLVCLSFMMLMMIMVARVVPVVVVLVVAVMMPVMMLFRLYRLCLKRHIAQTSIEDSILGMVTECS